jgi:hypothetical protein
VDKVVDTIVLYMENFFEILGNFLEYVHPFFLNGFIWFVLLYKYRYLEILPNYRKYRLLNLKAKTDFSSSIKKTTKIKGKIVKQDDLLISPFSQKTCVFYKFVVEQQNLFGIFKYWTPVIEDIKTTKCVLQNDTGEILLNLENTEVELSGDNNLKEYNSLKEADQKLLEDFKQQEQPIDEKPIPFKDTLQKLYSKQSSKILFSQPMRIRELIIKPGDEINVIGKVSGDIKKMEIETGKKKIFIVCDDNYSKLANFYLKKAVKHLFFLTLYLTIMGFATYAYYF